MQEHSELSRRWVGNCSNVSLSPPPFPHVAIDGDGVVVALTFIDGQVHLRSKFVATKHRTEEQEKKKFLYRGQMGTHPNSVLKDTALFLKGLITFSMPRLKYRNPSNTNVFYWGGKARMQQHILYKCSLLGTTVESIDF